MNDKPFWMKGAKPATVAPVAAAFPVGPAISQAEAEGQVVAVTPEVLPPEALSCVNVPGISAVTAGQLKTEFRTAFGDAASVLEEAAAVAVTDVNQTEDMAKAKALRLRLKAIRCDVEKVRKEQKADSLMRGKVIDGVANALKGLIEPAEAWLLEQELFAERAEQRRIDALRKERQDALAPYLTAADSTGVDLAFLSPDVWESMLEGAKLQAQHRAEVAKQEEQARRDREESERAERKRLADENERLRKEQADKDAENKRLRDEAEKAQKAEADRLAEAERLRLEKEAADKAEADRLAEIARKAASAPDKEKALAYLSTLRAVPVPVFTSEAGKRVSADIARALDGFCKVIAQGINNEL